MSLHWNGSLSPKEFSASASSFAEKWKELNPLLPHWSWITTPNPPPCFASPHQVHGYLSLHNFFIYSQQHCGDDCSPTSKDGPCCDQEYESVDDATLVQSYDVELHHYDFHIVYSSSYRVPVLYFRACCSDGRPLTLDEVEKDLPANSRTLLSESKWTFITQEEHPYLNRPWFTLHPCGTTEWMKLLYTDKAPMIKGGVPVEQYIVSWFSVVGQVVGLRLPLEMLQAFRLDDSIVVCR